MAELGILEIEIVVAFVNANGRYIGESEIYELVETIYTELTSLKFWPEITPFFTDEIDGTEMFCGVVGAGIATAEVVAAA